MMAFLINIISAITLIFYQINIPHMTEYVLVLTAQNGISIVGNEGIFICCIEWLTMDWVMTIALYIFSVTSLRVLGSYFKIYRNQECGKFEGMFNQKTTGLVVEGGILATFTGLSFTDCVVQCILHGECSSINVKESGEGAGECQLTKYRTHSKLANISYKQQWSNFHRKTKTKVKGPVCEYYNPCKHGKCEETCEHLGYKCVCEDGWYGRSCTEELHLPCIPPFKSCKDVVERTACGMNESSFYPIQNSDGSIISMYCDMTTDGGGWTLVTMIGKKDYEETLPSMSSDISTLNHATNGSYAISCSGLAALKNVINFTQIRIFCFKPRIQRTFHIVTTSNKTGYGVVDFMTGKTNVQPDSCGSYTRMEDDNSTLAQNCDLWFQRKWSEKGAVADPEIRLLRFPVYIFNDVHVAFGGVFSAGRFECDDLDRTRGKQAGTWKVFVR